MNDGAPPHFLRIANTALETTFNEYWNGGRGPVSWPALSFDPKRYGFLVTLVYLGTINDGDALQQRV